jgi:hypothetical protein
MIRRSREPVSPWELALLQETFPFEGRHEKRGG